MAFNLTRTTGTLASLFHAQATTGTLRTQLICVPGRLAQSTRTHALHLPTGWLWATQMTTTARHGPPAAA